MAAKKVAKALTEEYWLVSAESVGVRRAREDGGAVVQEAGETLWLADGPLLTADKSQAKRFGAAPTQADAMCYDGCPVHRRIDPKSLRAQRVVVTHEETGKAEKLSD